MTRDRAKELLPVIQAFADGKIIQILGNNGQWFDLKDFLGLNATFDSENCTFRLKPEPRELMVCLRKNQATGAMTAYDRGALVSSEFNSAEFKLFREVLP